jgi:hypothetical protein
LAALKIPYKKGVKAIIYIFYNVRMAKLLTPMNVWLGSKELMLLSYEFVFWPLDAFLMYDYSAVLLIFRAFLVGVPYCGTASLDIGQ